MLCPSQNRLDPTTDTTGGNNDGAFIGSGSMLVAPVRIGAGATIGAGSTITASTPEHKLTLERSRQVAVDEWQRPVKMSDAERRAIIDRAIHKSGSK